MARNSVKRTVASLELERMAHRAYAARWADLRAQGAKAIVLSRREHPDQWRAWLAYFQRKGLTTLADTMLSQGERSVPTWWPHDFDLNEVMRP